MENNHLREPDVHINDSLLLDDKELDNIQEIMSPENHHQEDIQPQFEFQQVDFDEVDQKNDSFFPEFQNPNPFKNSIDEPSSPDMIDVGINSNSDFQYMQLLNELSLFLKMSEQGTAYDTNQFKYFKKATPFFFPQKSSSSLTQLICIDITQKNKDFIKYSHTKMTCIPIYTCYGCDKQFENPSAFGGHISRCQYKQKHQKIAQKVREEKRAEAACNHRKSARTSRASRPTADDQDLHASKIPRRTTKQIEKRPRKA